MNPDRAEEYFCRGCQGENPEDIEFYDEQLQAEKVEVLNIRLEVKNLIIYNLINNKPISTPLSIGVFLRLFIYLKHIRNIMGSLLMEVLKKLMFLMIFLILGSG
ncbi:TPA: hypothetical protein VZF42_001010 [Streptococcus pneumoniae]|nr:hypothetical protein [Streptococcus pneumoniae]